MKCSTTNVSVTNKKGTVVFNCPSCNKDRIVRSPLARKIGSKYKCKSCGFIGPN
ncbi:RNA-binding protein [Candidatus Woesearchaeota archaeon]|nr:RNA-binding protein [Candidatus Woesearchaeota archaeon]